MKKQLLPIMMGALILTGCATESSRVIESQKVETYQSDYRGVKAPISVGKFNNQSSAYNGIFSDGVDRLGNQAQGILVTHLHQTGRFNVLNRTDLSVLQQEASIKNQKLNLKGANYVVTGAVAEFGRKDVGDRQLFGILGRGKAQIAYAKVDLNIVDARTSEIVYSTHGEGEYQLKNREIAGFGGTSGYDSTLNGKVLDLAIREAVNNLTRGMDQGQFKP